MTTIDSVKQFLEVQLQAWVHRDESPESARKGPVIAITREPGSGGEAIARQLARELGLVLYDWEILEQIAKDAHVSAQVVASLDVKNQSGLDEWLSGFGRGFGFSSYQYMQTLRRVLFTVATHGSAVILGRGANFLLPPEKRTLGLCLVAPREVRVSNTVREFHLSQESARKRLAAADRQQWLWVRKNCHADSNDATHYHMVLNTAWIAPEAIVRLVKDILPARDCPPAQPGSG